MKEIVYLGEENFESVLGTAEAAVVDFYADWCAPCKAMLPTYEAANLKYGDRVLFCKVNVDNQKKLAIQNRVMGIPCFMFFKRGRMVNRMDGAMSEGEFTEAVEALL